MFKLPIISTSEGGIPDIIEHGTTGFIVNKQNPEHLAEKINWLIDYPDKATLMGEKGKKKFFKNYTIEVFEKQLISILNF
jgi:glycosyltransferase involved in cell wall biosynthesis